MVTGHTILDYQKVSVTSSLASTFFGVRCMVMDVCGLSVLLQQIEASWMGDLLLQYVYGVLGLSLGYLPNKHTHSSTLQTLRSKMQGRTRVARLAFRINGFSISTHFRKML